MRPCLALSILQCDVDSPSHGVDAGLPPLRLSPCQSAKFARNVTTQAWRQSGGTEQIEQALGELLPQARVARMDRDTTSKRGSQESSSDAGREAKSMFWWGRR